MKTPPVEVVAAHPDLFTWILGVAIFISVAALIYHIRKADQNNSEQWKEITDNGQRISTIEGKCSANHK